MICESRGGRSDVKRRAPARARSAASSTRRAERDSKASSTPSDASAMPWRDACTRSSVAPSVARCASIARRPAATGASRAGAITFVQAQQRLGVPGGGANAERHRARRGTRELKLRARDGGPAGSERRTCRDQPRIDGGHRPAGGAEVGGEHRRLAAQPGRRVALGGARAQQRKAREHPPAGAPVRAQRAVGAPGGVRGRPRIAVEQRELGRRDPRLGDVELHATALQLCDSQPKLASGVAEQPDGRQQRSAIQAAPGL